MLVEFLVYLSLRVLVVLIQFSFVCVCALASCLLHILSEVFSLTVRCHPYMEGYVSVIKHQYQEKVM